MKKGKKKVKKHKHIIVDWGRVISLSAAGKYIQDRLDEELKKYTPPTKKKKVKKIN